MTAGSDAVERARQGLGWASARPSTPDVPAPELAYRPDLDGLRAIAVALVMLSHAHIPWSNYGGDAGVTAFFVLSGYLITRLLEKQRSRGRLSILAFYKRRIVRLGPALLGVLGFVFVLGSVLTLPSQWQLGILSCLAYVSNWVQVQGINISPLGHTWSLAIEEQFYLVWPVLIALLPRRRLIAVAIAGIVIGSLVRTVAVGPFEYFSTITRGDAILLGCLIALTGVRLPAWSAVVGVIGLVVITLVNLGHDFAVPGAMIAAALIVASHWAPLGVLAPIGRRAYSLYLWNLPMTVLFGPILGVPMTVISAELSFRLLEVPVVKRWGRIPATTALGGSPTVPA
jgi:peptidoglycan/LPS O-acetylase OafA/YrhL